MSVFSKVYEKLYDDIVEQNEYSNHSTSMFLSTIFYSTVLSSFSYKGDIPKFIENLPYYIQECFFMSPIVAYFHHEGEVYITPAYPSGVLLDNGLYSTYTCIFRNGKVVIKKYEDIVLGFNNSLGLPDRLIVDEIKDKCVNAMRAVDCSLDRASVPELAFLKSENVRNSVIKALSDASSKATPYALIDSSNWGEDEPILTKNIYDNRAQDILALWDVFVRYKNMFFTTYGVNNVEISKTERLTRAEGESNTEMTRYGLFYDEYQNRLDWFRRIKEFDGSVIEIEINRNYETVSAITLTNEEKRKFNELVVAPYSEQEGDTNEEEKEEQNDENKKNES